MLKTKKEISTVSFINFINMKQQQKDLHFKKYCSGNEQVVVRIDIIRNLLFKSVGPPKAARQICPHRTCGLVGKETCRGQDRMQLKLKLPQPMPGLCGLFHAYPRLKSGFDMCGVFETPTINPR